ncbi:hypothetical protein Tco_1124954 [Tanacetum coccineum]|uniref:Uncharacterized protein n=1 Tax=Tanacetum coccineum TaxID=301880 RepID=A0ABQ5J800_9ASTR
MPRILIPLRPILGVLQIGIKSQDPPSHDYVPGPYGPPSPDYVLARRVQSRHHLPIYIPIVPEPFTQEFLPVTESILAEEQPMSAADSPTHHHQADYPADKGDDDDDDDDDTEEEEHLAPADPTAVAYSADQDPIPAYVFTELGCPSATKAPQPSPTPRKLLRDLLALPTPPHHLSLHTHHSLPRYPLHHYRDALPVHETEMPEMCLPLHKRPLRTTPGPGYERIHGIDLVRSHPRDCTDHPKGVNQRVIELSTTVDQEDEIIYSHLDDARYDRALLRARVNRLDSDRPFYRRTKNRLLIREADYLVPAGHGVDGCLAVSRDPKDSEEPQGLTREQSCREQHGPAKILQSQSYQRRP